MAINKQFYLFTAGAFCINIAFAQTNQGARLTAMGNNGTAVKDIWGVVANPAGITDIELPTVQLNFQKPFIFETLSHQALAFAFTSHMQTFGFSLQRYGIPEYFSNEIGFVAAKQFGPKLAIGIRVNYHQIRINNYGTTSGISIDLGTIYQLNNELCFGLYVNNPSRESYRTTAVHTAIPTTVHIGVAYKTGPKLLLASTLTIQNRTPPQVTTGMEYKVIESFCIRSGLSVKPLAHYAGIGFNYTRFLVDFTYTKNSNFNYSPQITIGYVF